MIAEQSGMDYSPGIHFETSIINMNEAKALTIKNQPGKSMDKKNRCRCGSIKHLRITSEEFPIGLSYQNTKKALEMGLYQQEVKKEE